MSARLVAVSDSVFPNLDPARAVLSKIGAELRPAEAVTAEAIMKVACHADALLVTYAKITAEMIREMKNCQIISRFGIGVDNVDIPAATAHKIVVTKVPDYCIDEVSDHAMALLLAMARKIPASNEDVHAGKWDMRTVVPIHRLRGSTLGLIGFGRIPQVLAPKAQSFGLHVVAYDPYVPAEVLAAASVRGVSFDELLKVSDYVSIHAPLLPETQNLFNSAAFKCMKPSAYLINTARGAIVDEADLAAALDAGQLAGAALDVMSLEPPGNSPLFGRKKVILTPHTSFYSDESLVELQSKAAEEVARVLTQQSPRNPVNPEAFHASQRDQLPVR
jgi:D-3-phosphoglycerate dehydrogenase